MLYEQCFHQAITPKILICKSQLTTASFMSQSLTMIRNNLEEIMPPLSAT